MNLSIGPRWEKFVEDVVRDGRYGSASEVVREGLRLVEEREAKLRALRTAIEEGLDSDFTIDDQQLSGTVQSKLRELREKGY